MITYGFRPIIFQSIHFSILSEFMIKYWKNNMFSLIYQSGMSFMMFTGVFEDSNQVIFDHQASNSNFLFNPLKI
jgi:hypothetical protein